jgi:ubiquinone/menaquinone biosynthesis C-methylase UbiE
MAWKEKQQIMQRYDTTAEGYNELHGEEQEAKYRVALQNLPLKTTDAVLDVGCGSGLLFPHVADKTAIAVGVDLSRELLKKAQTTAKKFPNTFIVQADADHLPFTDAVFGAVFSFTVLQNMPNPQKTLQEWKRVTKAGGNLVVTGLKKAFPLDKFLDVLEDSGLRLDCFVDEDDLKCYVAVLTVDSFVY